MTTPWVRVVVVNYNGGAHLPRVLDGLRRQSDGDFEVVVVDNGSTDGSLDGLPAFDGRFHILRAGRNLGFAAGCNLGAQGAKAPWLAMLNPDAVPQPHWLAKLREAVLNYPAAAAFGSTQLLAENEALLDGAGDNYSIFGIAWRGGYGASAHLVDGDIAVFSPCAAAALYRRDAFEAVGGFAESFFCYLEDVDLGFRLRLAGHDVVQVAAARVSHVGSAIAGRYSVFTVYHAARNGVYLMVRCLPLPLLLVAVPLHLLAQVYLMWRMRALVSVTARAKGVWDGLCALPRLLDERRDVQRGRRASLRQVVSWLVWRPKRLSRRQIVPLSS